MIILDIDIENRGYIMENKDFLKQLEEALDEPSIIAKLKTIVKEKKKHNSLISSKTLSKQEQNLDIKQKDNKEKELYIHQLQLENDSLKMKCNDLQKEKDVLAQANQRLQIERSTLEEQNKRLNQEENKLKDKIEQLNNEMLMQYNQFKKVQTIADNYTAKYSALDDIYSQYKSLNPSIHQALANVIPIDDPETFLCVGGQWENIEALWDFISYQLDGYGKEELQILIETFEYFFRKYNSITKTYTLLETQVGEILDEDLHTRASNSSVSGKITEVLLLGYQTTKTEKIIKKSIVRV